MNNTQVDVSRQSTRQGHYVSKEEQLKALAARLARQRWQDVFFRNATLFFASLVLILLGAIIFSLASKSIPIFQQFGLGFLTSTAWNPVTLEFGAATAIYGTVVTSIIALLIGPNLSWWW